MNSNLQAAVNIVDGKRIKIPGQNTFGRLKTFSPNELRQLKSLRALIVRYLTNSSPPRPLCLAIFGPPGSGKSFAAKEICSEAKKRVNKGKKLKLPLTVVNMTQVGNASDVARVLARIAGEQDEEAVPVVFIDEFDTSRDGAPLGWLSWFLAPMHDGQFLHEGATIRLQRAIYLFAGGTADTMDDFSASQTSQFRLAKGPDFVSRLRGYLDVQGPNEWPREIRRAIILRSELDRHLPKGGTIDRAPDCTIDSKMLTSLLCVGRYRHGARSIGAILEMNPNTSFSESLSWEMLPENHILELHVDRGPLDAERIGGPIALSGYSLANRRNERGFNACWMSIADALWDEGATVAYVWVPDGGRLMDDIIDRLRKRPVEPKRRARDREKPNRWLEGYMSADMSMRRANRSISATERAKIGLLAIPQARLESAERKQLSGNKWKINMLSRFRRRFVMSAASVARFAVGGWKTGHKGRVPGIAEEIMLTLAFKKPVYVAGGFGGAAEDLGILLGLSHVRTGDVPSSFLPQKNEPDLLSIADKLQPPPLNRLPVTSAQVVAFLKEHAFGNSGWPDNGLSWAENQRLFASTDPKEVARLVVQGLRKVFVHR